MAGVGHVSLHAARRPGNAATPLASAEQGLGGGGGVGVFDSASGEQLLHLAAGESMQAVVLETRGRDHAEDVLATIARDGYVARVIS